METARIVDIGGRGALDDVPGPRIFIAENAAAYVALGGSQCLICEMPRRFCTQVVCRNISGRPPVYVYWREEA